MESWAQVTEYIDNMVARQQSFNIDDLLPQVRHLPLPWNSEEPLKSLLRKTARDCAKKHDIELRFNHHGRAIYAESREELMKLLRERERRLRSEGKRFALVAMKIQQRTKRKKPSNQPAWDFERGTLMVPGEMHRSAEEVAATANVTPLRPLDEEALWPIMVDAFTHGNPDAIPPFHRVLAEFVRRQLGAVVPEEVFREDLVPVDTLRVIYGELVRTMEELVNLVPPPPAPDPDEGSSRA